MGERVTIYDIAREAETSASTVSRVLNGSALVTGPKARIVLDAAQRLGYSPRRIRRHASRAILHVVLFLPHAERPQTHLFYDAATLISGIQEGFGDLRTHLIVSLSDSTDALTAKKLGDIDGCIFAFSSPTPEVRNILVARSVPTIMVNRVDEQFSFVTNDAGQGIQSLVEEVERRRPGEPCCFISVDDARPVADYRTRALDSVTSAAGRRTRPVLRTFPTVAAISPAEIKGLHESGIRIFMCVNDYIAIAVCDRLNQLGLSIPDDAGVTGYDAAPVRGLFNRQITSIDLSVLDLGRQAAELLGDMVVERSPDRAQRFVAGALLPGETL